MYSDKELTIRPIEEKDLFRIWELELKDENPERKKMECSVLSLPIKKL